MAAFLQFVIIIPHLGDGHGAVDKDLGQLDEQPEGGDPGNNGLKDFVDLVGHEVDLEPFHHLPVSLHRHPLPFGEKGAGLFGGYRCGAGLCSPFFLQACGQGPMDHEVRVPPDGGGEMGVVGGGQAEMADIVRGVAGLLHGAQQEIADDVLLGGASRQSQHLAEPLGRAVAVIDRKPHALGKLGELGHLERVGRFVDAVEGVDLAFGLGLGHRLVGGQHELLDELVGLIALAPLDGLHGVVLAQNRHGFGEFKADAPPLEPLLFQAQGQLAHAFQILHHVTVLAARRRILVHQDLLDFCVGEAILAADDALHEAFGQPVAVLVKIEHGGEGVAVLARHQAAEIVGQPLRQHGDDPGWEIDAGAALVGLHIHRGLRPHIMADIGDGDIEPITVFQRLDGHGVIKITGRFPVDGHVDHAPQIGAGGGHFHLRVQPLHLGGHLLGKEMGQVELADDHLGLHLDILGVAKHL